MNYIQFFAKGGKATVGKMVKWIQETLGVNDDQMAELWQIGINKYGSVEGIEDALNKSLEGINEASSPDEIKAAVVNVFSTGSEMFKCGGKLQRLASKFSKGGSCGCVEKKEMGGETREGKVARKRYTASDYHNNIGDWVPVNGGVAQNYRPFAFGLTNHGIGGNALEQVLVTEGDNGTPRKVIRRIEGFFNPNIPTEKLDTVIFDANGATKHSQEFMNKVNLKLEGLAPQRQVAKSLQDGGLMRAKNYYANHGNEAIIRKLQTFLASRGYDLGNAGIDGKFGQSTYNAIRQYQKDNGLKSDGMWGEDTNSIHRVLTYDNSTFSGPRSGAHPGKHTFVGEQKKPTTANDQRRYLNEVTTKAYSNPEWFWSDAEDANAARDYMYKLTNNGKSVGLDFIKDVYDNYTSPELQKSIAYKKLPTSIQQERYNQGVAEAINEGGKTTAKVGAGIAGTLLAAEAIPILAEYGPAVLNTVKTAGQNIWNPIQGRTSTFFTRAMNGAIKNNASGQFVSNAGMNMGQFVGVPDYAGTIANNLRMLTPVGFKCGGKMKTKKKELGGEIAKSLKCGGKTKKK